MKLTIWFAQNAYNVVVDNVESIRIVGPNALETATFGNSTVVHRNVSSFEVEDFDFDTITKLG